MAKTKRQLERKAQRKRQSRQRTLVTGGIVLVVTALIAVIVISVIRSPGSGGLVGDEVTGLSRAHISIGTPPGPYNSNPPAGGPHYPDTFPAGFYQESDLASLPAYPEGYLVHNLEHGYVIFWYNCQIPNTDCSALKQTIQTVMDETGNTKLIAFPWSDMDVPLAMTSWGRILKFQSLDPARMKQFVESNRNTAPESGTP
jgi:hypothetical protein